jgi:signal transduction histidine kinase
MVGGKLSIGQYTERRESLQRAKKLAFIARHPILEIAYRVADKELQKARAERNELIRAIAHLTHDINNVLTTMSAVVGVLKIKAEGSSMPAEPMEEALEKLSLLKDGCHRIGHIAYSAIELSSAESGRIQVDNTPFDAVEQSKRIVEHMEVLADMKGFQLLFKANGPMYIMSDHRLFDRVLSNIVGNALKYTERGSVTVSVTGVDDTVTIRVADTGPGIRKEDITAIFNEHYRGESAAGISGKGLGLYIAKSYTELMGGRISVESELGKGSTFILSFPLMQQ